MTLCLLSVEMFANSDGSTDAAESTLQDFLHLATGLDDDGDTTSVETGRISKPNELAMVAGFQQIDEIFGSLVETTNMPPERLRKLYHKFCGTQAARSVNPWNMYQAYFSQHEAEETARLPENVGSSVDDSHDLVSTMRRCYNMFRSAYPDTWRDILEKSVLLDVYSEQLEVTVGERQKAFDKVVKQLEQTVRSSTQGHPHSQLCTTRRSWRLIMLKIRSFITRV